MVISVTKRTINVWDITEQNRTGTRNTVYLLSHHFTLFQAAPPNFFLFVCSQPEERSTLLRQASCVLYTPSNEHFGIVPVEAMCSEAPVIAVNSGGGKSRLKPRHDDGFIHIYVSSASSVMRLMITATRIRSC